MRDRLSVVTAAVEASRSRRAFLKDVAATALMFVGCAATSRAQSLQGPTSGSSRAVMLGGRRVRTIDIHTHCVVPEASTLLQRTVNRQAALPMAGQALTDRLQTMDAQRIDMSVLSINPNWYDVDRDLAAKVVSLQNESVAAFCASHADRFAAFASVALQFPDLAVEQLVLATRQMGFRGVAVGTSVAGLELSDPKFHPFWAKAEELGSVVFIHPQTAPELAGRLKGNGALNNVIGNPLEMTIALSHLIFEGTMDRFPGLKICAAHGGGYLPSYKNRSDVGCKVFPEQCTPGVPKKAPTEYLKQMYFDSVVFETEALRHLVAEVGASRVVLGSDQPYPWASAPVDHILKTPGLSDGEREAMLGGTAAQLLGLSVART